jgi:hypothetical protein
MQIRDLGSGLNSRIRNTGVNQDSQIRMVFDYLLDLKSIGTSIFADPDPGFGAFLTPGSGMGKNLDPASASWIQDDHPGLYFRKFGNAFLD